MACGAVPETPRLKKNSQEEKGHYARNQCGVRKKNRLTTLVFEAARGIAEGKKRGGNRGLEKKGEKNAGVLTSREKDQPTQGETLAGQASLDEKKENPVRVVAVPGENNKSGAQTDYHTGGAITRQTGCVGMGRG